MIVTIFHFKRFKDFFYYIGLLTLIPITSGYGWITISKPFPIKLQRLLIRPVPLEYALKRQLTKVRFGISYISFQDLYLPYPRNEGRKQIRHHPCKEYCHSRRKSVSDCRCYTKELHTWYTFHHHLA
jgi:hypothetical protein